MRPWTFVALVAGAQGAQVAHLARPGATNLDGATASHESTAAARGEGRLPRQGAQAPVAPAQAFLTAVHEQQEPVVVNADDDVHHQKKAGNGYLPASPLYGQQQAVRAGKVVTGATPTLPSYAVGDSLPTTITCIINLTCQYFLVYAVFVLYRCCRSLSSDKAGWDQSIIGKMLETAQGTVNYIPMLCVLFLAVRLRAIQLTQGQTDKHGLPQWWVRWAMEVCTFAVFAELIVVLLFPCCFQQAPSVDNDGLIDPPLNASRWAVVAMLVMRFLIMALLYGGFTTVCVGLLCMWAPTEVYPDGSPPISHATVCIMSLSLQYFIVYLILAMIRLYNQHKAVAWNPLSDTFQLAAYTVNFAPMLCILFFTARLRALQMDPTQGNPQVWAQVCFYLCTVSVLVQTLLVIIGKTAGFEVGMGPGEGDIIFSSAVGKSTAVTVLNGLRWFSLACLYGGFTAIIVSIIMNWYAEGSEGMPPDASVLCMMHLSVLFFGVYLALVIVGLMGHYGRTDAGASPSLLPGTLDAARSVVSSLCPMLCILFMTLRMRALYLTSNLGAPQGWAQDCMLLVSWLVLLQLITVFLIPCVSGKSPTKDAGVRRVSVSKVVFYCLEGWRVLCTVLTYFCVVALLVALVLITSETANSRGAKIPVPLRD